MDERFVGITPGWQVYGIGAFRGDGFGTSRKMGLVSQEFSRCMKHSRATGVEAMLNWSLTGDILWANRRRSVIVFRTCELGVHVSVTQVSHFHLETHETYYPYDASLTVIFSMIDGVVPRENQRYVFTPSREERHGLPSGHVGRDLTRENIEEAFLCASVIPLETLSKVSRSVFPRWIGVDARHWLEIYSRQNDLSESCSDAEESLSLAVRADAAMIIRLLVTPGSALMNAA